MFNRMDVNAPIVMKRSALNRPYFLKIFWELPARPELPCYRHCQQVKDFQVLMKCLGTIN